MAILKMCSRCRTIIDRNAKMCSRCLEKDELRKKARYKSYDKTREKDKCIKFYKSKEWLISRASVLERDNYMCKVCWDRDNKVSVGTTVHHIVELREAWDKRCDKNNLITVCASCHKIIHDCYKKDINSKNNIMNKLLNIVEKINRG